METKTNKNIILTIGGVILVVVIGLLIYFANQPAKNDTSTKTSTTESSKTSSSSVAGQGTGIDGSQTTQEKLDKSNLPQLTSTVSTDEAEVQLQTSLGNIDIKLFPKLAPHAVQNFLALAKEGYYKNNEFFRVINDFMIQTGDPSNKGTGSKVVSAVNGGKSFDTEISNELYNIRGAVALANTGAASSSSSQFFIVQNSQDMTSQLNNYLRPTKIADAYKKKEDTQVLTAHILFLVKLFLAWISSIK